MSFASAIERNTMDVHNALAQLKAYKAPIKAVVMVPTYRAAAKFIERTKDAYPGLIYTTSRLRAAPRSRTS